MPRIMRCEPYRAVHGLFLAWKDVAQPEAAIKEQLNDLKDTLEHYYKYDQIETWEIPSHKPYIALDRKLRDFIDDNDGEKTLLIVYYRGHAARDGRSLVLKLHDSQESPGLSWTAIQHKLMVDVEADVLLILDCCHAYSAAYSDLTGRDASSESRGCVGLLASVDDGEQSHLRGDHTFTKNLIAQLEESHAEPVEVARLSNGLEKRCRNWRDLRPEDAWKIKMPRFQNLSIHIDRQMWLMRIDERAGADKTPQTPPAVARMPPPVLTTRADAPQPTKPEMYLDFGPVASQRELRARKAAEVWTERQHMLQQLLNSQIDRHNNECLVKVAILSSGVDETSPLVSAAAGRGRFEARDFTGSKSCADELGVGTHSVNVMLYMTKYVKIYAAKVVTNDFSQEAIASPIRMALKFCIDKWNVDLIVLPFGFRQPVSGIDLEINRGHAKGKLIMAAANFFSTLTLSYHLSFPACMPGVMAIAAADGLGHLSHPIFPPPYSPSVEFSTLGLSVPDFEDDETAPSWRHFEGRGGSSVAVVVAAALLCNAWKYTWCIIPDLPGLVTWCKMPFTREGSRTLLRLMSLGFSAGRANGLAARTVDALPDWGAAY
ncbi:hypothetical protein E5D57_007654 [Metarhizium anisopliae]|nr:hypothetical protein E5D57_007654 [Metarhizium anisopliae]